MGLAVAAALMAALALLSGPVRADLQVLITKGVTDPIPIAVVPFAQAGVGPGGLDVAGVVQQDLTASGRFRLMPRQDMHSTPSVPDQVQAGDWRSAGNDYVAVGRVSSASPGAFDVQCSLINTAIGQVVGSQRFCRQQREPT